MGTVISVIAETTPVVTFTYAPHRWESTAAWVVADSPFEPTRAIGRQKLPARQHPVSEALSDFDWIVGFTFEGPWGPVLTDPTRSEERLGRQIRLQLLRTSLHDVDDLATLYREFALEDRALAEIGLGEYARLLDDADADER
jgi:hypothetical protein